MVDKDNTEPLMDKIVLIFRKAYLTKTKTRFDEELGEEAWSKRDVAIGYIYPYTEAIELIGSPERVKVTIEPL